LKHEKLVSKHGFELLDLLIQVRSEKINSLGNITMSYVCKIMCSFTFREGKGEAVPVHATKAFRESRGIAPPILSFGHFATWNSGSH
jgi:hypothetical protein